MGNTTQKQEPGWLEAAAPAKLNLFLEVLGKRPDGYHEVETVMHAVDLCDSVRVRAGGDAVAVRCAGGAPSGPANIAHRAACALREAAGTEAGAEIELQKRIPAGAGLGGGSSDAAAVLKLLNRAWGLGFSPDRLAAVGARVGSDVPFFFAGGTAVCRGRGERVEPVRCGAALHFVLVWPDVELSTRDVYARLAGELTGPRRDATLCVEALHHGKTALLEESAFNRLEGSACALHASISRLKRKVQSACRGAAWMTGSGSAVFGLCGGRKEAEEAATTLAAEGKTFAVSSFDHS